MITFLVQIALLIAIVYAFRTQHLVLEVKKTQISLHLIWWKGLD